MKYTSIHIYHYMVNFFITDLLITNIKSWSFIVVLFNMYVYMLTLLLLFSLFFLLDPSIFKLISNLRVFSKFSFTFNSSVFIFLSLAGMPPFLSFIGKFFLFVFLFLSGNMSIVLFFFLFNSFVIYFYIQHLRLFITKSSVFLNYFKNFFFYWNFSLTITTVWLLFFLIFGVFFVSDFFILLSPFFINL